MVPSLRRVGWIALMLLSVSLGRIHADTPPRIITGDGARPTLLPGVADASPVPAPASSAPAASTFVPAGPAPVLDGQKPTLPAVAPPSNSQAVSSCWNWLCGDVNHPITAGDPEVNPGLWQHTWGYAAVDLFPVGDKMAPNGVAYDPLFSLDLLLNIALTRDRRWYIFAMGTFWGQKAGEGITNQKQGNFDFSKRQFDLDGGIAWNFYGRFEGRLFFYSYNNLNRGNSLERPFGYKDGSAVEIRYWMPNADFDKGLYRYLGIGYMPTKELVGMKGDPFKPSLFLTGHVAYDILPDELYLYLDCEFFTERPCEPRLLCVDPGVAWRPFQVRAPNLEFRLGVDSIIDFVDDYTRYLGYVSARVVW
ncbi:MAG: hypothetical protein ACKO23_16105 [Gemmataceae bacterium]